MTPRVTLMAALLASACGTTMAQPSSSIDAPPPAQPPPVAKQAAAPSDDMQAVLTAQMALGAKPVGTLSPLMARLGPSTADGALAVMRRRRLPTAPNLAVVTKDVAYGTDPMQYARIYKPARAESGKLPMIVFYHGSGWVIADVNTYDATPRLLSKQLNAIVVSVEYRHAPEARFPAQH